MFFLYCRQFNSARKASGEEGGGGRKGGGGGGKHNIRRMRDENEQEEKLDHSITKRNENSVYGESDRYSLP